MAELYADIYPPLKVWTKVFDITCQSWGSPVWVVITTCCPVGVGWINWTPPGIVKPLKGEEKDKTLRIELVLTRAIKQNEKKNLFVFYGVTYRTTHSAIFWQRLKLVALQYCPCWIKGLCH